MLRNEIKKNQLGKELKKIKNNQKNEDQI